MLEDEMKFRLMQDNSRKATLDTACMIENILIRVGTDVDREAAKAYALLKKRGQAK
jgi:hypothetical protein